MCELALLFSPIIYVTILEFLFYFYFLSFIPIFGFHHWFIMQFICFYFTFFYVNQALCYILFIFLVYFFFKILSFFWACLCVLFLGLKQMRLYHHRLLRSMLLSAMVVHKIQVSFWKRERFFSSVFVYSTYFGIPLKYIFLISY